ncbi:hypothetical protein Sa4125_16690 [Aureimonas sp. SA4125]|uniref:winged helix-turn-helix domain-containing protein n=1 Tax=Aureimonas sp. SA4125 TaxID=2826993 RepID=UPI001CC49E59|nr:LysR family transcriptional regulator [Aureimonas sp. SA4125]BDA84127.1 hypothetical protein Sa4125_16690 [Aureimonas sp. SA4125]
MPANVTLRLDFDAGRRLGHGKIALLEAVERHGSIAAAGREFGMSYRRAWLLVDELNRMFSAPMVAARGGGRNGGGAALTETGSRVVALYRAAEKTILAGAAAEIDALEALLATSAADASPADPSPLDLSPGELPG